MGAILCGLAMVRVEAAASDPATGDVAASDAFVIEAIRLEGLQRIAEGTVYNYLPLNIGDHVDSRRVAEAIRALYATGFFQDVELRRDSGALIVAVMERPVIESFEIKGNKDIKTEDLQKSLRGMGLASGKSFDKAVLDEVKQYLTEQYFSRGKYAVRIAATSEELPGNRVKVAIEIREGARARIQSINIVGNHAFDEVELLRLLQLRAPNWLSWYRQDDRYAKESLAGDLETLRSYYMDRGYADFAIASSQVALAPEKDDIFITINITEGEMYRVSDVKLAGNLQVSERELGRLLAVSPGQLFSQRLVSQSSEAIKLRLGLDGYAFATVDAVPKLDHEKKQVSLSLVVDAGYRAYVHRINFLGTTDVNDEVLRREMRQLEGAYLSNTAVERSKIRLQRLPFIKEVEIETTAVPGTPDLVDLDVKIEPGLPGQFGGGLGYSESQSFILNGNIAHSNFMGTGQRVAAEFNGGKYSKLYSFSHTDPYITIDGITRTLSTSYRDVSRLTSSFSSFSTETYASGVDFSYPITELQSVQLGTSLQHVELTTLQSSSQQLQDWVTDNGNSYLRRLDNDFLLGTQYDAIEISAAWVRDSRNRVLFPTQGSIHRFIAATTAPTGAGSIDYLRASFQYQQFFRFGVVPLIRDVTFSFNTKLSYAQSLGGTTAVPPNLHYFTGGPDSVRGFREATLGPRDSLGNSFGGDAAISGQIEALLPMPKKFAQSARASLFFDFGQSFYLGDTEFKDKLGEPKEYKFDLQELRTSVGIGVQWLAPLGLFRFSYAVPLRFQRETFRNYGDDLERFQFSIGNAF
jgi:outer membrane protein insertion porin family